MGQHLQEDLVALVGPPDRGDRSSESSLVAAKHALDLPPLAVDTLRPAATGLLMEPTHHLASVFRLRPPAAPTPIERDHRRADAQLPACCGVVVFRVVRRVGQCRIDRCAGGSLANDWDQVGRVLGGSAGDGRCEEQVGAGIDDGGQFGPMPLATATPALAYKVVAHRTRVVAGRIDRSPNGLWRRCGGGTQEGVGVFFLSRLRAFWAVVKWGTFASPNASRSSAQSRKNATSPR